MNSSSETMLVPTPPIIYQGFSTVCPPFTVVPASFAKSLKPFITSLVTISRSFGRSSVLIPATNKKSVIFYCTWFFPKPYILFKVNNWYIRIMYEICLKSTIKTPERCHWTTLKKFITFPSVYNKDFEQVNFSCVCSIKNTIATYIKADNTQGRLILWMAKRLKTFTPLKPIVAFISQIEIDHLFCRAKQITGFYMKCNTGLNWIKPAFHFWDILASYLKYFSRKKNITEGFKNNPHLIQN